MTYRAIALVALAMSCAKPSPRVFQVTVDDRYGVYQAVLNTMMFESPVSAQLMDSSHTSLFTGASFNGNPRLERFNSAALASFDELAKQDAGTIDLSRLEAPYNDGGVNGPHLIWFGPVSFDPTGTYGVSSVSVPYAGLSLFEVVRTEGGHWALVRSEELAVY